MKVTVELSDKEMREICRATGEKKKGPAIRKMVQTGLKLRRRREMTQKFVTGEWSVEFKGYEESVKKEKEAARRIMRTWRG